jgi:hypothetical protein
MEQRPNLEGMETRLALPGQQNTDIPSGDKKIRDVLKNIPSLPRGGGDVKRDITWCHLGGNYEKEEEKKGTKVTEQGR